MRLDFSRHLLHSSLAGDFSNYGQILLETASPRRERSGYAALAKLNP
jgi:hypothetical protein